MRMWLQKRRVFDQHSCSVLLQKNRTLERTSGRGIGKLICIQRAINPYSDNWSPVSVLTRMRCRSQKSHGMDMAEQWAPLSSFLRHGCAMPGISILQVGGVARMPTGRGADPGNITRPKIALERSRAILLRVHGTLKMHLWHQVFY